MIKVLKSEIRKRYNTQNGGEKPLREITWEWTEKRQNEWHVTMITRLEL